MMLKKNLVYSNQVSRNVKRFHVMGVDKCFKKRNSFFFTGKNRRSTWRKLLERKSYECDGKLGVHHCCSLFGT